MQDFYYIEADGGIFLVEKDGVKTLPSSKDDIPFAFSKIRKMPMKDEAVSVWYCVPTDFTYAPEWLMKDDLVGRADVGAIVQRAVVQSLPRAYAGAVVAGERDASVLLVLAERGFSKDLWSLPCGFLQYGEDSAAAAVREGGEETGLELAVKGDVLTVYTKVCGLSGFYAHGFAYECGITRGVMCPKKGEIKEVKFMPVQELTSIQMNNFTKYALAKFATRRFAEEMH